MCRYSVVDDDPRNTTMRIYQLRRFIFLASIYAAIALGIAIIIAKVVR